MINCLIEDRISQTLNIIENLNKLDNSVVCNNQELLKEAQEFLIELKILKATLW